MPLLDSRLAAIDSAVDAAKHGLSMVDAAERDAWRCVVTAWELDDALVIGCVVTPTHFVHVGGPGWRALGYEPAQVVGRPWADFVATDAEVAASRRVVAHNRATGLGVDGYVNHYRLADGSGVRAVRWRVAPWFTTVAGQTISVGRGLIL